MPIIPSLSNRELMMINSNNSERDITQIHQDSKSRMFYSRRTDGSLSSDNKNISSHLHKSEGNEKNGSETITLRKVIRFMLGVSLLTGVDLLFRNSAKAKCIDIVSSKNVGSDYEAMRFSPLLFNETQSPTYPTVMNEKHGHNIIKRNANHPYRYYYTENQDEKCKTSELQGKCKKAHVRVHEKGKYFTSLILKVGKTDCFCPPPDNHRVEIIELNNHSHGYYYSENQDKRCNSRELLEKCQATHAREHEKGKHFTLLILKVGKIDCSCPPPENKNAERVEPNFDGYISGAHVNDNYVNIDVMEIKNNITTHSYLFFKRSKKSSFAPYTPKIKSKGEETHIDDVTIKRLFDYSCAQESQKTNLNTILKLVGETLANPITQISQQINIYYNYNVLYLGCPSARDQERLAEVTEIIDSIMGAAIQLLPGSQAIAVLQNIISPLLIAASEAMEGKGTYIGLLNEVNQNAIFMFQDITRSLSVRDYTSIDNKASTIDKKKEVKLNINMFEYKNGKIEIWLDNDFYELHYTVYGVPVIFRNGRIIPVIYHKSYNKWVELHGDEKIIYSENNVENIKKYGFPIEKDSIKIEPGIYWNIPPIEGDTNYGEASHYIFTYGKLIEIQPYIVNYEIVLITASTDLPKRIIRRNKLDWFFEKESATTDKALKSFISENCEGEELTKNNLFTNIGRDGFSYNSEEKAYLKIKNKYYPLQSYDIAHDTCLIHTKYNERVSISKSKVGFSFKWNTAIPTGIGAEVCGIVESVPHNEHKTTIDRDAYDFLLLHAIKRRLNYNHLKEVFRGVYRDTRYNNHVLIVNGERFAVTKYSEQDNLIFIKSNDGDDVKLYVFDDLIIRTRERSINEKYVKLRNCNFKRDLTDETCLPILMSESLKNKLDGVVKESAHVHINDAGVVRYDDIPGCFSKDNELYFYHEGFLFKAEISDYKKQGENAQIKRVELFIHTFLRKKKHVASFVVDIKKDRIELKEEKLFLAEKTGIRTEDAEFYLKNNRYYLIPNFLALEHTVNEVNKHGLLKIIDPPFKTVPTVSDEDIISLCHRKFFPTIREPDFTILSLDNINDSDPFYFTSSKVAVLSAIKQAKHILNIAIHELSIFTPNAERYIKLILRTERAGVARKFSSHMQKKLRVIRKNLDRKNIRLVSIDRTPVWESRSGKFFFKAALSEDLRRQGIMAFTVADETKKIYLSIDKLNFIDPEHPDPSLREPPAVDMVETLIHESTHIDRLTTDIFYFNRDREGKMYPILDEVDRFLQRITKLDHHHFDKILKINKEYINSVEVYKSWEDRLLNDKEMLLYFSSSDTGILANYYLYNADFITKIVGDIYQNSFVERPQFNFLEKISRRLHFG